MKFDLIEKIFDSEILRIKTLKRNRDLISIEVLVASGGKYQVELERYYDNKYSNMPFSFKISFFSKSFYTEKCLFGLFTKVKFKLEPLYSEAFTLSRILNVNDPMHKIIYKLFGINENSVNT